jgi:hypothetical protein
VLHGHEPTRLALARARGSVFAIGAANALLAPAGGVSPTPKATR